MVTCKASDAGLASQEALRAAEAAILDSLEAIRRKMWGVGWLVGWVGLGLDWDASWLYRLVGRLVEFSR